MTYFYWQKTVTGKWSPVKSPDKPSKGNAHGGWKGKFTDPIELTDPEAGFDLESLAHFYPPPDATLAVVPT